MASLFSRSPAEPISVEELEEFCGQGIKETTRVDYKTDFPANLARTISAFANTHGGLILLGVQTDEDNRPLLPIKGLPFEKGLEERIHQICNESIDPPLIPSIWLTHVDKPGNRCVVVIRVEESDDSFHTVEGKTGFYLRTGNISHPFRRVKIDEIAELLTRRKSTEELRTRLLSRFRNRTQFFYHSYLDKTLNRFQGPQKGRIQTLLKQIPAFEFYSTPVFPRNRLTSLAELRGFVSSTYPVRVRYQGAQPLLNKDWRLAQESLLAYSGGNFFQYAEISQYGLVGYRESNLKDEKALRSCGYNPATEPAMPRVMDPFEIRSACLGLLLFLPKLYEKLGFWGNFLIGFRMGVVAGYRLCDRSEEPRGEICPDDEITWSRKLGATQVRENLEEVFVSFVEEFYSAFDLAADIRPILRGEIQDAQRQATSFLR